MADEDWLTTSNAAQLSGYHVERIRELIREGKVKARKFGPVWAVSRESLLTYVRKMEVIGGKRGPAHKTRG
jgi:excisionase family DNA binding protein